MTKKGKLLKFKQGEDGGGFILRLRKRLRMGGAEVISILSHKAKGEHSEFKGKVLHLLSFRMFLQYIYELIESGDHPELSPVKFMLLTPDDQAIFKSFYSPEFDYDSFVEKLSAYENEVCDFHRMANTLDDEKMKAQAETRYAFMHWIMDLLNERVG